MFEDYPEESDGLTAEEWAGHFQRYVHRQQARAAIAAAAGAEWFEIGHVPVFKISESPDPQAGAKWQELIQSLQTDFGVSVLCKGGAYWMNADNNFVWDPPDEIAPYCDALKVSMACSLAGSFDPTVEEMQATAETLLQQYLHLVAQAQGKPVVLEISYSAYENSHTWLYMQDDYAPWCPEKDNCPNPDDRPPMDLQHQADVYEAILWAAVNDGFVAGISTWGYWPMGHTPENGFVSIRDKLAEKVFVKYALAAFIVDTDGDGMDDQWEESRGYNVGADDSQADNNSDGIPAIEEFYLGL